MDDIYYQKYLKYKNKYLSLKADIDNQYAGANIKVTWKVNAKVTRVRTMSGPKKGKDRTDFNGDRVLEFGTVTDTRSIKENGKIIGPKTVTTPYFRVKGKIYEIIKFQPYNEDPLDVIKNKKIELLQAKDAFNRIVFYEQPCHSITAGKNRLCNENRVKLRMDIVNAR